MIWHTFSFTKKSENFQQLSLQNLTTTKQWHIYLKKILYENIISTLSCHRNKSIKITDLFSQMYSKAELFLIKFHMEVTHFEIRITTESQHFSTFSSSEAVKRASGSIFSSSNLCEHYTKVRSEEKFQRIWLFYIHPKYSINITFKNNRLSY